MSSPDSIAERGNLHVVVDVNLVVRYRLDQNTCLVTPATKHDSGADPHQTVSLDTGVERRSTHIGLVTMTPSMGAGTVFSPVECTMTSSLRPTLDGWVRPHRQQGTNKAYTLRKYGLVG